MNEAFLIYSATLTHPGLKRRHNEDFVAFYEPESPKELMQSGRLYIVADGVGGAAKGEKASQYAAQKVLYEFYSDENPDVGLRLRHAFKRAGNDINKHIGRSGLPAKMATTMVAAVIRGSVLTVANVGDSRAYLIRNGQVQQITRDHTIAGELLRDGQISEDEAMHFKGKNRLTRSLGGEQDVAVDLFQKIELQTGDRILLCSDGLARYTSRDDIARLVINGEPEDIVQRCVDFANDRGGVDNVSVAFIQIGPEGPHAAPTIKRRGTIPVPVDWDEMETQPSMMPPTPRRKRNRRAQQNRIILIAGIPILLFAILTIVLVARSLTLGADPDEITSNNPATDLDETDLANQQPGSPLPGLTISPDQSNVLAATTSPDASPMPLHPLSNLKLDNPTYEEPFDAVGDWTIFDKNQKENESEIFEGNLAVSPKGSEDHPQWNYQFPTTEEVVFENFYAEVQVSTQACSGNDIYGIVVRYDEAKVETGFENGYGLELSCSGTYRIRKFISNDQDPEILSDWSPSEFIFSFVDDGRSNLVGVFAYGEELCAYANNEKIAEFSDNEYSQGTIGFYAIGVDTSNPTFLFDDLRVWETGDDFQTCPESFQLEPTN